MSLEEFQKKYRGLEDGAHLADEEVSLAGSFCNALLFCFPLAFTAAAELGQTMRLLPLRFLVMKDEPSTNASV